MKDSREKALVICNVGFEDETRLEIEEILSCRIEPEMFQGILIFDIDSRDDLAKITYESQTAIKTFLLSGRSDDGTDSLDYLSKMLCSERYREFLGRPLKVFCKDVLTREELISSQKKDEDEEDKSKEGLHRSRIISFADSISKAARENLSIELKVSMNDFKTGLYLIQQSGTTFLGIDFSGKELSKRDYRIFCHKNSLNATIASSLIYFSGADQYLKKSARKNPIVILDPFCGSGTIPIEFALKFNRISPQHFEEDKLAYRNFGIAVKDFDQEIEENESVRIIGFDNMLPNIKASQKNSKIANINKFIEFSKVGTDWLDIKFSEKEVNMIVTDPPVIPKIGDEKEVLKSYKELFYQAEYILKKDGTVTIISQSDRIKGFAEKFELVKEKEVFQGKQKMLVMQYRKK